MLRELERVLEAEIGAHEALEKLLAGKLEAVRQSRSGEVEALCGQENHELQRLAELAKQRIELVGILAERFVPQTAGSCPPPPSEEGGAGGNVSGAMTLGKLAKHLPQPQRQRVQELRDRLASRMQQVRRRTGTLRRASQALLRHMHGVMQTVAGALSEGGMYGRGGRAPGAALAVSTFNATG